MALIQLPAPQKLAQLLLRNNVRFYTERLWDELPAGWGESLVALRPEDIVSLASPAGGPSQVADKASCCTTLSQY